MKNASFIQSVQHACNGIVYFFTTERNAKIQLSVGIIILLIGVGLGVTKTEWVLILFAIGLVLCFEMLNTAIECLCNVVHKEYHPVIKHVKNLAAGAVLIASIISCTIGIVIFLPKLFALFT